MGFQYEILPRTDNTKPDALFSGSYLKSRTQTDQALEDNALYPCRIKTKEE